MNATAATQGVIAEPAAPSGRYANYVLAVLSLGSILSFVDRQIINLLVEPIKRDLGISDTQIGILQGFSFVIFYAILAIPLARLADRGNRVRVITLGVLCWSAATFLCGLAGSFAMLFAARMVVGVGEATLTPSAYSLIPDYFSRERAAVAISIFTGSGFVGSGIAYIAGGTVIGYLNAIGPVTLPVLGILAPWQLAFLCVSVPGLALMLLLFTVNEPPRRAVAGESVGAQLPFRAVLGHMLTNARLFCGLLFGLTLLAAGTFAINAWTPTFLMRVHGWSPAQVGSVFGALVVAASAGGVFSGGVAATALMRRGVTGANVLLPLGAALLAIPFAIAFPLAESANQALMLLTPALFLCAVPFGCGTAVLPLISHNRMRAQVVAIYLLVANLVGFTAGPTSVGLLTDYVYGAPEKIGLSLATSPALFFIAGAALLGWALPAYRLVVAGTVPDGPSGEQIESLP